MASKGRLRYNSPRWQRPSGQRRSKPAAPRVQPPETVEAWVHQVNTLAAELDARCATLHPTAWAEDPDIPRLTAQYQAVAGTFSVEEAHAAEPAQLTLAF